MEHINKKGSIEMAVLPTYLPTYPSELARQFIETVFTASAESKVIITLLVFNLILVGFVLCKLDNKSQLDQGAIAPKTESAEDSLHNEDEDKDGDSDHLFVRRMTHS